MLFSKSTLTAGLISLGLVAAQTNVPKFQYGTPNPNAVGVKGRNKNGPTNPAAPSLNTPINQTSEARLASINAVDDWCTFSSPDGRAIADTESITVAYCTKARNNARVIPDGTLTAVHFVKTPLYVQVMALGDFTKIGIPTGDQGGELDPHGATNMGNPIGGNVTSNVSGQDEFYEEWMNYISYQQVCFRVCIAGTDIAPTPLECQHTLDEMGCNFVMPGSYSDNVFDTCLGDSAYPPGIFPQGNGQTSTFQQYYSSVYSAPGGQVYTFVNGSPDQQTPTAAYSLPSTSSCTTTSTIANGIKAIVSSSSTSSSSGSMSTAKSSGNSGATSGSQTNNGATTSNSGSGSSTSGASRFGASSVAIAGVAGLLGAIVFLN